MSSEDVTDDDLSYGEHSSYANEPKNCDFCDENFGNDDWRVTFLVGCHHVFHVNCLSDGSSCPACELNLCQRVKDDFKLVIASMKAFFEEFDARVDSLIVREGLGQGLRQQLEYLRLKMAELKSTVEGYESKADLCTLCERADIVPILCTRFKHLLLKRDELQSNIRELTSILIHLTSVIRALGSVVAA